MTTPTEALIYVLRDNVTDAPGERTWQEDLFLKAADALEAALPRTVTTAEELDALPVDAVVLSDGTAYQKGGHRFWFGEGSTWSNAGVFLPATVLYTPEVTA